MGEVVKFVGVADGPKIFVAELGTEVATFTVEPGGKHPALKWHVPLAKRGPFRATDLANYDPEKEYRTDNFGFLLCYQKTQADEFCKRKAVNRFPRCNFHGGRVHPLDKLVDVKGQEEGPEDPESMSRYQLYLAKQLSVDDLDDEEIMGFGFRAKNGNIYKPKNISREMVQAFTKCIFERSLDSLKANALEAVKTLTTIMMDPAADANVRLKAAEAVLDRTLGKAPQVVSIQGTAPWETVFEGLSALSREESRRQRGMDIVDAEVVPEEQPKTTRTLMQELEALGDNDQS